MIYITLTSCGEFALMKCVIFAISYYL